MITNAHVYNNGTSSYNLYAVAYWVDVGTADNQPGDATAKLKVTFQGMESNQVLLPKTAFEAAFSAHLAAL